METQGSAVTQGQRWSWGGLASGIACLLLLLGGVTVQSAVAGGATDAMKSTIDEVLKIIQDKELKQPGRAEERRQRLEQVVGDRFDYQEMSRRALGAPWNTLSDKDKQEFVALFRTLLTNSYADKVESYSGEGVQYINERTEKDYAEVRTKVLTGKTEIPLDYRLLNKGNDWRVYDVVVDGVSLVNNYRGQFSKILRSSNYADLVDQLRKKSDKIKAHNSSRNFMTSLHGCIVAVLVFLAALAAMLLDYAGPMSNTSRFRRVTSKNDGSEGGLIVPILSLTLMEISDTLSPRCSFRIPIVGYAQRSIYFDTIREGEKSIHRIFHRRDRAQGGVRLCRSSLQSGAYSFNFGASFFKNATARFFGLGEVTSESGETNYTAGEAAQTGDSGSCE